MNKKTAILISILVIALVTMACGIEFNLPDREVKTGPLQTVDLQSNVPDNLPAILDLEFGAGELNITPGNVTGLFSGKAIFNVPDLAPVIEADGNIVRIKTGNLEIKGIPNFEEDIRNEWILSLGNVPISLEIGAGAYSADYELGGLSISKLKITDGASSVKLKFSSPNLVQMESFVYETGASKVSLKGLANANIKEMVFRGGAGDYELDFSGLLVQDQDIKIESGISKVKIIVPEGTAAQVKFASGLANIEVSGNWIKQGELYLLAGTGPVVMIEASIAAGTLELDQ